MAPVGVRKTAQGNTRKPSELVVLSSEKRGLLKRKRCRGATARPRAERVAKRA
jgi:hypothetical protein